MSDDNNGALDGAPARHNTIAPQKAYENLDFLASREGRALRILSEYLEPKSRFDHYGIADTVVFMGSARVPSRETADANAARATANGEDATASRRDAHLAHYYEAAVTLAYRLTQWSKNLGGSRKRRFVVCTGGGPGLMEAANRGASEARGLNIGLSISLPAEEGTNPYVTRGLAFDFHYFFMRKFWFAYQAKAVVMLPGGFGTLDELFELLTLVQTGKMDKHLPIVLFGTEYWDQVLNLDTMVDWGMIDPKDRELVYRTDSVDDAYNYLVDQLSEYAVGQPGAQL